MKTLILKIIDKYDFKPLKSIKIKGYSSTIILRRYCFEIKETNLIEPLNIIIQEVHENNIPVENTFRLSIVNCSESNEPQELFLFTTFEKLDLFITSIILNN